jgi:hypothetical protein
MSKRTDSIAHVVDYQRHIDRLARAGYEVMATETFGVAPKYLSKRGPESGIPSQSKGVEWEQLPERAKQVWRRIAERILTEDRGVQ